MRRAAVPLLSAAVAVAILAGCLERTVRGAESTDGTSPGAESAIPPMSVELDGAGNIRISADGGGAGLPAVEWTLRSGTESVTALAASSDASSGWMLLPVSDLAHGTWHVFAGSTVIGTIEIAPDAAFGIGTRDNAIVSIRSGASPRIDRWLRTANGWTCAAASLPTGAIRWVSGGTDGEGFTRLWAGGPDQVWTAAVSVPPGPIASATDIAIRWIRVPASSGIVQPPAVDQHGPALWAATAGGAVRVSIVALEVSVPQGTVELLGGGAAALARTSDGALWRVEPGAAPVAVAAEVTAASSIGGGEFVFADVRGNTGLVTAAATANAAGLAPAVQATAWCRFDVDGDGWLDAVGAAGPVCVVIPGPAGTQPAATLALTQRAVGVTAGRGGVRTLAWMTGGGWFEQAVEGLAPAAAPDSSRFGMALVRDTRLWGPDPRASLVAVAPEGPIAEWRAGSTEIVLWDSLAAGIAPRAIVALSGAPAVVRALGRIDGSPVLAARVAAGGWVLISAPAAGPVRTWELDSSLVPLAAADLAQDGGGALLGLRAGALVALRNRTVVAEWRLPAGEAPVWAGGAWLGDEGGLPWAMTATGVVLIPAAGAPGVWRTFDAGEPGTSVLDAAAAPARGTLAPGIVVARQTPDGIRAEYWDLATGERTGTGSLLAGLSAAWEPVPDVEPDGWRNAMLRVTLAESEPDDGRASMWTWFALADETLDESAIAYPWDNGRCDAVCLADADGDGDTDCLVRDAAAGWTLFRNSRIDR